MQVWDDNIIETAEEQFYDSHVAEFVDAINQNITVSKSFCKRMYTH